MRTKITKKLMQRVLFQAYQKFNSGPGDIYTVPDLRNCEISDYVKLLDSLTQHGYIRESGEPDHHFITHRGEMFGTGQNCPCRECKPKDYA